MQEILQKQGMIGGKQMRFRCRKTPINLLSIQVFGAGGAPQLQSKTVTPSTSQQTVRPDDGYDGLSSVQVNAISPTKGAETFTPNTQDQTISSGRWLTGTQTIKGDANLVSSNIKSGVSIFGVNGNYSGQYKFNYFSGINPYSSTKVRIPVDSNIAQVVGVGMKATRYNPSANNMISLMWWDDGSVNGNNIGTFCVATQFAITGEIYKSRITIGGTSSSKYVQLSLEGLEYTWNGEATIEGFIVYT